MAGSREKPSISKFSTPAAPGWISVKFTVLQPDADVDVIVITRVDFKEQVLFIQSVLTHEEYSREDW